MKLVKDISKYFSTQDWVEKTLVRVSFPNKEDFLKIAETLTRIGVQPKKDEDVLYQSCHILHKRLKKGDQFHSTYFIVHFKEFFILDGKTSTITDEDIARRNTIAKFLEEWGLLKILNPEVLDCQDIPRPKIKIIKSSEKHKWDLRSKYTIGKRR